MTTDKKIVITVLVIIAVSSIADVVTDSHQGASWWHMLFELVVATLSLLGAWLLLRSNQALSKQVVKQQLANQQLQQQATAWQQQAKQYIEGLSKAIIAQLQQWQLTQSEQDVALLLLKGFSVKEIAELRNTAEKTVRVQATAIYSKSGLQGRHQLSAFFLEDLLSAQIKN